MKRFNKLIINFSYMLFTLVVINGCSNTIQVKINETLNVTGKLIYQNKFTDLSEFVVEQAKDGEVEIKDGKLEITDAGGCTIWVKEKFEGPIMIEYDVVVLDNGEPHDRVSDLNCFWMASDPKNPDDLFANSESRGGIFPNYDSLQLYYTGVGGHYNKKTRFRRYKGNGEKPLLPEHDLSDPKFLLEANKPYHIEIIAFDDKIQYYRNNQLIFDYEDENPYKSGHFGFRTVNNHMTVDNFKVYQLNK